MSAAATNHTGSTPTQRWRNPIATALIVLGCVVAIPATALSWTNSQLTNTNAYVETVAPLIDNPDIQRVITDKITTAIFDHIDTDKLVNSGVGALKDAGANDRVVQVLNGLSDPLQGAVEGFVGREVSKLVASDTAAELWREINDVGHAELASALSGDDTHTLQIHGNKLIADIGVLSVEVKRRLAERGFGLANLLPTINTHLTLLESPQIGQAQDRYQLMTFLGSTLPWLATGLIVAGLAMALSRQRALIVAGIGLAIAMVTLAIALWVSRTVAAQAIPSEVLPSSTALVAIDTLLRSIWRPIWFLASAGAVTAIATYLAGPAKPARQLRASVQTALRAGRRIIVERGGRITPVDAWVRTAHRPLLIAVPVIVVLMLAFWSAPTWRVVVWLSASAGCTILLITFLALPEPTKPPAASTAKKRTPAKRTVKPA